MVAQSQSVLGDCDPANEAAARAAGLVYLFAISPSMQTKVLLSIGITGVALLWFYPLITIAGGAFLGPLDFPLPFT